MNPISQNIMKNHLGLYALFAVVMVIGFFAISFWSKKQTPPGLKFVKKPIMTENELEFFGRLRSALPDFEIFAQVAMSAIVKPLRIDDTKNLAARNKIDRKVIDFVIYSRSFELICIVELDDRTHNAARDTARDALTAGAGIRTLRWKSNAKPTIEAVRQAVLNLTDVVTEAKKMQAV